MKKFLFFITALISSAVLVAQDNNSNCMTLFPNNPGATLITKTYDIGNNVISTMTYKVTSAYDYPSGDIMNIRFVMTDNNDNVIDQGDIEANCLNGTFQLKMINRGIASEIVKNLSKDTELVADFLDYPNPNDDIYNPGNNFEMEGGNFLIQSKSDKKEMVNVRVFNRKYVDSEQITTPAQTTPFDAAKVTFDFEVTADKKTTLYRGIEWYAMNAGIVRTETYDKDNNLISYSVLTTLTDK